MAKYLTIPNIPVQKENPKADYGAVIMKFVGHLFDLPDSSRLLRLRRTSLLPQTFEELGQDSGFVIYEHKLKQSVSDPARLEVAELHDRGYVFVDDGLVGILGRSEKVKSTPIQIELGQTIAILVENQGKNSQT